MQTPRQLKYTTPLKSAWKATRGGRDQLPDWRPDGKQIAYQAGRDTWIKPDGSGQVKVTNTPDVQEYGTERSKHGVHPGLRKLGGPAA